VAAFVKTADGDWNNLSRASAITVRPDRHDPDVWLVFAHYSGKTPILRRFPSERAARDWVADLLEGVS
jgi:hypothetical protein